MSSYNSSKRTQSVASKEAKGKLIQPINLMNKNVRVNSNLQEAEDDARLSSENTARQYHRQDPNQYKTHQNTHSLGRDLSGMGLITQVRQGEAVPTIVNASGQSVEFNKYSNISPLAQKHFGIDVSVPRHKISLLKPQKESVRGKKTLVLDLDETLVHSSFKAPKNPDIVLPVDIEGRICHVYVLIRPGCHHFLQEMTKHYELVMFTASLSKYADPLMDNLDQDNLVPLRLFREHCTFHNGIFVKDMSKLGRPMSDIIIIDNSPQSYLFQPENGMPIMSWYEDKTDSKLLQIIPALKLLAEVPDVRPVLKACVSRDNIFYPDKTVKMCQKILQQQQAQQDQEKTKKDKQVRTLEVERQTAQGADQYRITPEEAGSGLDEESKRMQTIPANNEKSKDKRLNKYGGEIRGSYDRKDVLKHLGQGSEAGNIDLQNKKPKVNSWLENKDDSSEHYYNFKQFSTQQAQQSPPAIANKLNKDSSQQYLQQLGQQPKVEVNRAIHAMHRALFDDSLAQKMQNSQTPNRIRSKTSGKEKDTLIAQGNGQAIRQLSSLSPVRRSIQTQNNQVDDSTSKTTPMNEKKLSQKKFQTFQPPQKKLLVNPQQKFPMANNQIVSTPQYQTAKLNHSGSKHSQRGGSSTATTTASTLATLNDHTKRGQPASTQNSSRNSVERMREKHGMNPVEVASSARSATANGIISNHFMRPSSQKKHNGELDPIYQSYTNQPHHHQAHSAQQQLQSQFQMTAFLNQYSNNKMTGQDTQNSKTIQQQHQIYHSQKAITPGQQQTLQQHEHSLMSKGYLGKEISSNNNMPPSILITKSSSSTKKSKHSSSQQSREPEVGRGKEQSSLSSMTPGKVFKFDRNHHAMQSYNQVQTATNAAASNSLSNIIREDGYSNLLKYQSLTQLKNQTKIQSQGSGPAGIMQDDSQNDSSQRGSIKGVKIINNHNTALVHVNKYSSHSLNQQVSQSQTFSQQLQTSQHGKINNMLSDYERTKTFNQELLKNIGSPKGPIFTRAGGGQSGNNGDVSQSQEGCQ